MSHENACVSTSSSLSSSGLYLTGGLGVKPPAKISHPLLLLKKRKGGRLSMYLCISTVVDFNSQNYDTTPLMKFDKYSPGHHRRSSIGTVRTVSSSRVYETVRCLSVRPLLQVCCCRPGGQEISIDCCSSGVRLVNAGSATLPAYVGS